MKQSASLQRYIGIFRMSPSQLEQLADEITASQSLDRPVHLSQVNIRTRNTRESYDSIEELRQHRVWKRKIVDIEITFSENYDAQWSEPRRIFVSSGKHFNYVSVSGDDVDWVEGTMDVVVKRIRKHYVWYHLFAGNIVKSLIAGILANVVGGALAYFVMSEFIVTAFGLEPTMEKSYRYIVSGPVIFFGFVCFFAAFSISDKSRIVEDNVGRKVTT